MLLAVGVAAGIALAWGLARLLVDDPAKQGVGATGVAIELSAPVSIAGRSTSLIRPGVMVPLDLSFDNPNDHAIVLDELTVRITGLDAPRRDEDHPCSLEDFAVRQLSASSELVLEARSVSTLSDLDVPDRDWPAVGMQNRPVNQDGCKGAVLTLSYEANGAEAQR